MICHMSETPTRVRVPRAMKRLPRIGDFFTNGRDLYEVMLVVDGRATMENCRTEFTTEYDLASLRKMRLVRAGGGDGVS
jgi:hypothetical protein